MHIGWPIGTVAGHASDTRQYVRDPNGALQPIKLKSTFDSHAALPDDAVFSGYGTGKAELWTSPADVDSAVYLVFRDRVERWPRLDPMIACA